MPNIFTAALPLPSPPFLRWPRLPTSWQPFLHKKCFYLFHWGGLILLHWWVGISTEKFLYCPKYRSTVLWKIFFIHRDYCLRKVVTFLFQTLFFLNMYISRAPYHEAEGHTLEILSSGPALWPPVDLYWWMSVCSLVPSSQTAKEIYLQGAGGRGSYFTLCLLCCSTRTCTHTFACAYTHTHTGCTCLCSVPEIIAYFTEINRISISCTHTGWLPHSAFPRKLLFGHHLYTYLQF